MITTLAEFSELLAQTQHQRSAEVRCAFSPALSARLSDAMLTEALLLGLPMVQRLQRRIVRSRGQGAVLTARLRYRDGVRLLTESVLTQEEEAALQTAKALIAGVSSLDEETRFNHIYTWVCRNIRYAHTAPGQKGYELLVSAAGALMYRSANCQGFADTMYLLCSLCGIPCEYRIGRGERQLHVWNAVLLNGAWVETDASKGARQHGI